MYIQYLKILLNKEYFNKYSRFIKIPEDNKEINKVLGTIIKLHETVETDLTVDDVFITLNLAGETSDVYKDICDGIRHTELSESVISTVLSTLKERSLAESIAGTAFRVATGQESRESLDLLYQEFNNNQGIEEETNFVTDDLETLYEQTVKSPGLRWRSSTLNRMLGSLRKGDFGFVFARPETGKTTFLASEVTYFATQTTRPILWFNNEEQGNKVMIRCYQAALGKQLHELMHDRAASKQQYLNVTGGNIRIFDSASIHKQDVSRICAELQPGLIIFDQIDKIKGFSDDREDLRLGAIYIWARELAKEYCPVVAVCQASGNAEGKRYLTMDDVANAKTAKQAEADWILGIGKTHDVDLEYVRHFSVCKNKLAGDEDTEPSLRHGRMDVRINPAIARYEDIM